MNRYLLITLLSLPILFGASSASASSFIAVQEGNAQILYNPTTWNAGVQSLGTGFTGTHAITNVYLEAICAQGGCLSYPDLVLKILSNTTNTISGASTVADLTINDLPASKEVYQITDQFTFDSSKYYFLTVTCTSGCYAGSGTNRQYQTYGASYNPYANGEWNYNAQYDWYFVMIGDNANITGDEQIRFRYPIENTTTPDFSSWVTSLSGMNAGVNYYIQIKAVLATSTVSSSENGAEKKYVSIFSNESSSPAFTIPKKIGDLYGPGGDGDRIWNAYAYVCTDQYCNSVIATDTIVFTTNFSSTIPNSPYTLDAGGIDNPDDYLYGLDGNKLTREQVDAWTAYNWCVEPTSTAWFGLDFFSGAHLAYGLCTFTAFILQPAPTAWSNLKDGFLTFEKIEPFASVLSVANSFKNTAGTTQDHDLDLVLDMSDAFGREDAQFAILTSSTLTSKVGAERAAEIRTVGSYLVFATVFAIVVGTILL